MTERIRRKPAISGSGSGDNPGAVRGIQLSRRRTRVPWIFLVIARPRRRAFVRRAGAVAKSPGGDDGLQRQSIIANRQCRSSFRNRHEPSALQHLKSSEHSAFSTQHSFRPRSACAEMRERRAARRGSNSAPGALGSISSGRDGDGGSSSTDRREKVMREPPATATRSSALLLPRRVGLEIDWRQRRRRGHGLSWRLGRSKPVAMTVILTLPSILGSTTAAEDDVGFLVGRFLDDARCLADFDQRTDRARR